MEAVLNSIMSNLGLWIPIALTIVSALATGLTKYPKAEGFLSGLQKFLSFFSVVTHEDAPKTFKMPFTVHKNDGVDSSNNGVMRGTVLVLAVSAVLSLAACKIFQNPPTVLDCATQALEQLAVSSEPQVFSILSGGSINWQSELDALLAAGGDAVICAVQNVIGKLRGTSGDAGAAFAAMPVNQREYMLTRAEAWLYTKGH